MGYQLVACCRETCRVGGVKVARGQPDILTLFEIVERTYPHPDAPEDAWITTTEVKDRGSVKGDDRDAAPLWMLYHAQVNIREPRSRMDTR